MPFIELCLAVATNAALLAVASWEFRRHGILANLMSPYPVIGLLVWTLAEVALKNPEGRAPLAYAVLMGSIGVSVVTDQTAGYILDVVMLPSCAFSLVIEASNVAGLRPCIGAFAVSGAMLVLYAVTRRQGLGLGDAKLAAATGALLGVQAGLISLGVSFVMGGCVAGFLILSGRASRKTTVPFAPYIAAGTLTVLTMARA